MSQEKKKVLVIDDSAEIRAGVTAILKHYGVICAGAKSAEEASPLILKPRIGELPYSLILLDIQLDGSSGLQLLRTFREIHGKAVPVVMISGNADTERVQEAAKWGISGFVVKPFTAETLWDRIKPLLGE